MCVRSAAAGSRRRQTRTRQYEKGVTAANDPPRTATVEHPDNEVRPSGTLEPRAAIKPRSVAHPFTGELCPWIRTKVLSGHGNGCAAGCGPTRPAGTA